MGINSKVDGQLDHSIRKMEPNKDRSRSLWVDHAKAIGIILVVYGHVARGVFSAGLKIDQNMFELVDSVIYSFHMPLFFFLSGLFFLASMAKRNSISLLRSKVDTCLLYTSPSPR